jgi:hypothetical protein
LLPAREALDDRTVSADRRPREEVIADHPTLCRDSVHADGPAKYDAEFARPLREAFARRLPPDVRRELEARAAAAYCAALQADGAPHAFPDDSDTWGRLKAAAVDLRETSRLLADIAAEPLESDLDGWDAALSMLAAPRAQEVEAIAERVEALLTLPASCRGARRPGRPG